jgi:hypothetical protein
VECSDVKIDLQIEDFYGEHDSMKKNRGKNGKNTKKRLTQLSDPWNQGHQEDLVGIGALRI